MGHDSSARIRIINCDDQGNEIVQNEMPLGEKEKYTIGRSQQADIKVMDIKVSRSHASIEQRGDRYYIVDHNSRNGTYVNGDRITTHELSPGDNIKVGFTILRYEQEQPEPAAPAPEAAPEPAPEAVYKCTMCNAQVTETDLRTGKAEEIAGKIYCPQCVKKTDDLFKQALVDDSAEMEPEDDADMPEGFSLADLIEEDDDEAELDLLPDD